MIILYKWTFGAMLVGTCDGKRRMGAKLVEVGTMVDERIVWGSLEWKLGFSPCPWVLDEYYKEERGEDPSWVMK